MNDDRFAINSSAAWMVFLHICPEAAAHLNPIPSQYRILPACQYYLFHSMMIVISLPAASADPFYGQKHLQ